MEALRSESSIDKEETLNHSRDETLAKVGGSQAKAASSWLKDGAADLVRRARAGLTGKARSLVWSRLIMGAD